MGFRPPESEQRQRSDCPPLFPAARPKRSRAPPCDISGLKVIIRGLGQ